MQKNIVIVLAVLLCVCQEQVFGIPPPGIQRVPREIENAEKVAAPQGIQRVRRGFNLENPQQKPFPPEGFF